MRDSYSQIAQPKFKWKHVYWQGEILHVILHVCNLSYRQLVLPAEFTDSGIKYFRMSISVVRILLLQVHVVRSSDQLRNATCMSGMLNVSYL